MSWFGLKLSNPFGKKTVADAQAAKTDLEAKQAQEKADLEAKQTQEREDADKAIADAQAAEGPATSGTAAVPSGGRRRGGKHTKTHRKGAKRLRRARTGRRSSRL
jgi:hypothetical protein